MGFPALELATYRYSRQCLVKCLRVVGRRGIQGPILMYALTASMFLLEGASTDGPACQLVVGVDGCVLSGCDLVCELEFCTEQCL